MSVGGNSQASGSATLEIGDTKVLCSVYVLQSWLYTQCGPPAHVFMLLLHAVVRFGPRAYTRGSLQYSSECVLSCDVKYAPFATEERREPRQVTMIGLTPCYCV